MHRRQLAALPFVLLLASPAWAQPQPREVPPEVLAAIPGATAQGGGRFRWFGFHMYDAWLYTAPARRAGADWAGVPLALELVYGRAFDGDSIAERSLEEMRRQAEIADRLGGRWLGAMKTLFPDVKAGDRIVGVQVPGEAARFFHNGQLRGELRDAEFTRLFFGIWLSARTSEPTLRDALFGTPP